jgi:diaminopimelate epimerase
MTASSVDDVSTFIEAETGLLKSQQGILFKGERVQMMMIRDGSEAKRCGCGSRWMVVVSL